MDRWTTALLLALVLAWPETALGGGPGPVRFPAAFPADVPLPGSAVLKTAQDLGPKGLNLVLETQEDVSAAAAGYGRRLQAAGWTLVAEAASEGAVFLSYRKGGRAVAVAATRPGKQTLLSVCFVEQQY